MNRIKEYSRGFFLIGGILLALSLGFTLGKLEGEIKPMHIDAAGELIGLQFTAAEKDSMLARLEYQLASIQTAREQSQPNSVPPALVFNPLPRGYQPDTRQVSTTFGLDRAFPLPKDAVDIAFSPVHRLAGWIRSGELSSEQLTRIYLERIKMHAPTLECLISLMEEEALSKARLMDAELASGRYRGPLHGIPYGVKDLLAVAGTKTTWGATPFKDQVIEETAHIVTKLDEAGAVLLGKFTLGALAMGDVWYGGVTKNPWNLDQGSSGSSAGSAAAVSAGLVPFAIGTETLGSIVSPSTRNGVTGLRPTFGRVSRHGAMALSWSMDKIGPISRSALDNAILLSLLNGKDPKDPASIEAAFNFDRQRDPKKLKIGYFKSFFEEKRSGKNDQAVLTFLEESGFELYPIELKTSLSNGPITLMLMVEGAAAFEELTRLGWDDQLVAQHRNAWPNLFRAARFIPAVDYVNLSRQRTVLIEEMHALMQDYDVIVSPSFGGQQLQLTNLTGHPALCLPNGFSAENSPTSITLLANLFEEEKLLLLGNFIQENTDWQEKRPPLFDR